jgi:hypothetical protein
MRWTGRTYLTIVALVAIVGAAIAVYVHLKPKVFKCQRDEPGARACMVDACPGAGMGVTCFEAEQAWCYWYIGHKEDGPSCLATEKECEDRVQSNNSIAKPGAALAGSCHHMTPDEMKE